MNERTNERFNCKIQLKHRPCNAYFFISNWVKSKMLDCKQRQCIIVSVPEQVTIIQICYTQFLVYKHTLTKAWHGTPRDTVEILVSNHLDLLTLGVRHLYLKSKNVNYMFPEGLTSG